MPKIAINRSYGGFRLSPKAIRRYGELKGWKPSFWRHDFSAKDKEDAYIRLTLEEAAATRRDFEITMDEKPPNHEYSNVFMEGNLDRDDPLLIQVIEELHGDAAAHHSLLKVVEVPDDVKWEIADYDGSEWVAEKHRIWQ